MLQIIKKNKNKIYLYLKDKIISDIFKLNTIILLIDICMTL